jgi:hypothetical protein
MSLRRESVAEEKGHTDTSRELLASMGIEQTTTVHPVNGCRALTVSMIVME